MIFHITTYKEWEKAQADGEYSAASLNSDGFIHCSTSKQTEDTANIFYKGQNGLVLLCIDEDKLKSELKFENPSKSGQHKPDVGNLFPHIYGPINISAVKKAVDFSTNENGFFVLPKEIIM